MTKHFRFAALACSRAFVSSSRCQNFCVGDVFFFSRNAPLFSKTCSKQLQEIEKDIDILQVWFATLVLLLLFLSPLSIIYDRCYHCYQITIATIAARHCHHSRHHLHLVYVSVGKETIVGADERVVVEHVIEIPHKLEHSGFVLVMDQRPAQHR